jgi:hypothetical protein
VSVAEADGIPQSGIVPIYQAFGGGGYSTYILPTAAQEQQILTTWGSVIPAPAFDYAYSWGAQNGDTAISTDPALQAVFAAHNAAGTMTAPPTITSPASGSTDTTTAKPVISGSGVAGDTVTVSIDGTVAGTTTVVAGGSWTYTPTSALTNASHTVTATQAAAGGPSSTAATDTFTVNVPTAPAAPTLTIADSSLTVTGGGGTVALGISVTVPDTATETTVTITGLPRYERITDSLDGETFRGSSIKLSEAQVDSGLTLKSRYSGDGHPVATLTITASDNIGNSSATSAPQTITVTDPPASTGPLGSSTGLLGLPATTSDYGLGYSVSPNAEFASIFSLLSGEQGMGSNLVTGTGEGSDHMILGPHVAASIGPNTGLFGRG